MLFRVTYLLKILLLEGRDMVVLEEVLCDWQIDTEK